MCGANPHPLYYKEEEMIIMCKVMLNSIDKVKEFVNKTSRVDGDVFLQSGRYIIDGDFQLRPDKAVEFKL